MDSRVIPGFSLIVAKSINGVIGNKGDIPWYLPDDFKWFKDQTNKAGTVIVGRKTQESIVKRLGKSLPDRRTIVLSHDQEYKPAGVIVARSIAEVLNLLSGRKATIIGGADIYQAFMPFVSRLYITEVNTIVEGDKLFPAINPLQWTCLNKINHERDDRHSYDFSWEIYERDSNAEALTKGAYVYLENYREDDQYKAMKEILDEGICPFCPEHLPRYLQKPTMWQGKFWTVKEPTWPYKNTQLHYVAVLTYHGEKLQDVVSEAAAEIFQIGSWIEKPRGTEFGGLGMRFGRLPVNGGTVRHLHPHFLSAKITDREHPDYKPVRLRVG